PPLHRQQHRVFVHGGRDDDRAEIRLHRPERLLHRPETPARGQLEEVARAVQRLLAHVHQPNDLHPLAKPREEPPDPRSRHPPPPHTPSNTAFSPTHPPLNGTAEGNRVIHE